MMTQLTIHMIEDATTQTGKTYAKIHTNAGVMSCWNTTITQALRSKIGQPINVDIETKGNFTSIKGLGGTQLPVLQKPASTGITSVAKRPSSFELSYAKDIFCALATSYENEDPVKKDEMLRYYAELSAELIMKMRSIIDEPQFSGVNGIQEEKVQA